jgi:hypothetical protein
VGERKPRLRGGLVDGGLRSLPGPGAAEIVVDGTAQPLLVGDVVGAETVAAQLLRGAVEHLPGRADAAGGDEHQEVDRSARRGHQRGPRALAPAPQAERYVTDVRAQAAQRGVRVLRLDRQRNVAVVGHRATVVAQNGDPGRR